MEELEAALPEATTDENTMPAENEDDGIDDTFDLGIKKKKKKKAVDINELLKSEDQDENGKSILLLCDFNI